VEESLDSVHWRTRGRIQLPTTFLSSTLRAGESFSQISSIGQSQLSSDQLSAFQVHLHFSQSKTELDTEDCRRKWIVQSKDTISGEAFNINKSCKFLKKRSAN
jgi:hypothetical protein